MNSHIETPRSSAPWNKGRLVGQKAPLKLKEIWAIRIRLQMADKARDLALFNLAIDSKLRGCDLVSLRVCDIAQGKSIFPRAMVMQRKTNRPVQFEITEQTRHSVTAWIEKPNCSPINISSPAGWPSGRICPPVSTPESWHTESSQLVWIQQLMERTPCVEQRQH